MKKNQKSCQCQRCQLACKKKPGVFSPDEALTFASRTGKSLTQLIKGRIFSLDVAFGNINGEKIKIATISPATKTSSDWGFFHDSRRLDDCRFYKNGFCQLHETGLKPIECKLSSHDNSDEDITSIKQQITSWYWFWEYIKQNPSDLLGDIDPMELIELNPAIVLSKLEIFRKEGLGCR